jgi:site-specific DNA-methyltransferase (adenine-specific)
MMIVEQILNNAPNPLLHIADVSGSALFNADCMDILPLIPDKSVQLILADLPYGATNLKWDSIIPLELLWKEYKRIIKDNGAIVLTATNPFASMLISSNYEMFKYDFVWHKNCPSSPALAKRQIMRQHELVLVFYKKQCVFNPIMEEYSDSSKSRIKYSFNVDKKSEHYNLKELGTRGEKRYPNSVQKITRETGLHPTQKPLKLMKYCIETFTNENDYVLDNTMGVGTTCLGAKELNRSFIGIEKEVKYYDLAVARVLG